MTDSPFRELGTVALARDLSKAGLRAGDLGAVVTIHGATNALEGLDVKFMTASGRTQALRTLKPTDVRPVRDDDLLAVRQAPPARSAA